MSTDLDDLLRGAGPDPSEPVDVARLWRRGRRRRNVRRAATAATSLVAVAALAFGATELAGNLGGPGIEPASPDGTSAPAPTDPDPTDPGEPDGSGSETEPEVPAEPAPDPEDAGPQPDPERVAEPCAEHVGREMEGFIAVVSPVDGQYSDATVELIGCANVYEATVNYRVTLVGDPGPLSEIVAGTDADVLDVEALLADGEVLYEGFLTATCGTGCLGTFDEVIDLGDLLAEVSVDADAILVVEVFWESAMDGSEQGATNVWMRLPGVVRVGVGS